MNKKTFAQKSNGDQLQASEWNELTNYINTAVDAINEGQSGEASATIDTTGVITVTSKSKGDNVTLGSPGSSSNIKNVNLEPGWPNSKGNYGDIALKPGDDIQFASHHREPNKRDKIVVKNIDGSDNPVKFEMVSGEINLSTKGKELTKKKDKTTGEDTANTMFKAENAKVLDVNIITGTTLDQGETNERDERGYLKVRAQAIDLRCEKHGGIALQPKGYDNNGNMNKIKFEHGGGDGLEFGTFNTEKSSLYTDEYRFKKDGIWKMSTRETVDSGKTIIDETENQQLPTGKTATGAFKYVKQSDDFYDIISNEDPTTTTEDIIKTAYALNSAEGIKTHITSKGNLEIESSLIYNYGIKEYFAGNINEFLVDKSTEIWSEEAGVGIQMTSTQSTNKELNFLTGHLSNNNYDSTIVYNIRIYGRSNEILFNISHTLPCYIPPLNNIAKIVVEANSLEHPTGIIDTLALIHFNSDTEIPSPISNGKYIESDISLDKYYLENNGTPISENFNDIFYGPEILSSSVQLFRIIGDPEFNNNNKNINIEANSAIKLETKSKCVWDNAGITSENFDASKITGGGLKADTDPDVKYADGKVYAMTTNQDLKKDQVNVTTYDSSVRYVICRQLGVCDGVTLSSDEDIKIKGKKVTIEGFEGFEPYMNFGETSEGIKFQYKYTKKSKFKECDILQVEVYNNGDTSATFDPANISTPTNIGEGLPIESNAPFVISETTTIPAKSKKVVAQASMLDIIKFVAWAKDNNFGPWSNNG